MKARTRLFSGSESAKKKQRALPLSEASVERQEQLLPFALPQPSDLLWSIQRPRYFHSPFEVKWFGLFCLPGDGYKITARLSEDKSSVLVKLFAPPLSSYSSIPEDVMLAWRATSQKDATICEEVIVELEISPPAPQLFAATYRVVQSQRDHEKDCKFLLCTFIPVTEEEENETEL